MLGETAAEAAAEARPLPRHVALVMVDRLDLATARRHPVRQVDSTSTTSAPSTSPSTTPRAQALEDRWVRLGMYRLPLELVECPDRRVVRAALEMADEAAADGQTEVSVLLPRRSYTWLEPPAARLASGSGSPPPSAGSSTSTPPSSPSTSKASCGIAGRGDGAHRWYPRPRATRREAAIDARVLGTRRRDHPDLRRCKPASGPGWRAGSGRSRCSRGATCPTLQVQLTDDQGRLTVAFLGRRQIAGLMPGSRIVVDGTVTDRRGQLVMINPDYEFVATPDGG